MSAKGEGTSPTPSRPAESAPAGGTPADVPAAQADATGDRGWTARTVLWLAVLLLAAMVSDLVVSGPLVALPQLLDHYQTDQAGWVSTVAFLASAVWAPVLGRLADVHGTRRVLIAAIAISSAGSFLCLIGASFALLMTGRALQGAAISVMFLSVTLIRQTFPGRIALTAAGVAAAGSGVLGIVAVVVTGFSVENLGFRAIFWLPGAFGILAAIVIRLVEPESSSKVPRRIDAVGATLFAVGIASVLAFVSLVEDWGPAAPKSLILVVVGVLALAAWFLHARMVDQPIVDVRTLAGPIGLAVLSFLFAVGGYVVILLMIGLIAQVSPDLGLGYGLGASADSASIYLAAPAVGMLAGGFIAGRMGDRVGSAPVVALGSVIGVLSSVLLVLSIASPAGTFAAMLIVGVGGGALTAAIFNLVVTLAPKGEQATTASLASITLGLASVVFTVVVVAVLNAGFGVQVDGKEMYTADGVRLGFGVSGALYAVAIGLSAVLVRAEAKRLGSRPRSEETASPT